VAPTPSIKIVKTTPFRGGVRTWSNRYHFNGGTPADSAHWTTLSDAIVTAEKAIYGGTTTIVQAVGYAAGSDVPVFTKNYTTSGTGSFSTFSQTLQVASLGRWSTTARTPKNHPVYLYSFWHDAHAADASTGRDTLIAAQATAQNTYGAAWVSGFSDGTNSYVRAGPNGATGVGFAVNTNLTHRDFPRIPA
jgi:hypothetical protein